MTFFTQGRVNEAIVKRVKLDGKDKKILSILSEDGRIPLSVIAKRIRASRDTVDYRIKRLVKNGIILGFIPQINAKYFGYDTYHVFMVINTLNEERKNKLIDALVNHPNTRNLMEYHGTWDLEWVLIAKSLKEFDSTLIDLTNDFKDVIVRKDKLTIIKGFKSIQLPGIIYKESSYYLKRIAKKSKKRIKVDEIDIKILNALSRNARASTYGIAETLNLSSDAISYRIKKMVSGGVIYGFTILTNLSAIDYHWYTFCINVKTFDINNDMKFREFISSNPYVLRAVKVLGDWDLLVYIAADTTEAFHTTFKQIQEKFVDIISDYQIWVAYKEHVYNSLPEAIIKDRR